ncbi:MAG: MFS transporter [Alphaproteobacteria bacterium]|nr:MFS transporter [Alphaproteobacteria bacterium]
MTMDQRSLGSQGLEVSIRPTFGGRITDLASGTQANVNPLSAWWTVVVFCALYAVSMLDRLILLVLARPMAATLNITDEQIGLLFGTGFAVVYTLGGLLIARKLDKGNRKALVVIGVSIWSLSTIASAFVSSFPVLLLLRSGVAIGEAVLTPAAVSILADLFKPGRRGLPTSLYGSSGPVMAPGAFIVGASVLAAASGLAGATGLEPWRITLILVGLPGVILALALQFTVSEPRRVPDMPTHAPAAEAVNLGFFAGHPRLWLMISVMHAVCSVAFMGWLAWTTALLIRKFGMSVENAGQVFGLVGLIGSVAAILFWPTLDMRISRLLGRSAAALLYVVATIGSTLVVIITGVAQNVTIVLIADVLALFFCNGVIVLPNLMVQNASPSANRARLAALIILANGLVGTGFGPLLTAAVAGRFFDKVNGLGPAMSTVGLIALPVLIVLGIGIQKPYRRAIEARRG